MLRLPCVFLLGASLAAAPAFSGIAVTGFVTTAEGSPLADARAELLPVPASFEAGRLILEGRLDPEAQAAATTDADGRFQLAVPRSGMWKVVLSAPGCVAAQFVYLPLAESRELPPVALRKDQRARVRVLDADGRPQAGVWVWAESASPEVWPRQDVSQPQLRAGRTDTRGWITFPRAAGERLALRVLESGTLLVGEGLAEAEATIRLTAKAVRTVELATGTDFSSEVLVRAGPLDWPVGLLEKGRTLRFATAADGRTEVWLETPTGARRNLVVPPAAGDEKPRMVTPPKPTVVSGRVLDEETRRPLAGALVWTGADPGAFVHTDAGGRYRLAAPVSGRFWIQAEASGHRPRAAWITPEQAVAGRGPSLGLTPAVALSGRVLDARGEPLPGARLTATPSRHEPTSHSAFRLEPAHGRVRSGDDGTFVLAGLEPGRDYRLQVSRRGHPAVRLQVTPPAAALVVSLARGRAGYGQVIDDEDRPVEGAEIELSAFGERRPHGAAGQGPTGQGAAEHRGTSNADGHFVIPRIPAENVEIAVVKEGFAPLLVRGVEIPREGRDAVDLGTVVLSPGAVVDGRVIDVEDEAVADASIFVVPANVDPEAFRDPGGELFSSRPPDARTDADGRFRLSSFSPGDRMHLFVLGPDHPGAWVQHVEVPLSEPLSIVLESGLRAAGRVVDAEGAPISGAELQLTWEERLTGLGVPSGRLGETRSRSDEEGRFAFRGLKPGPAILAAWAPGYREPEPRKIDLGSAEHEELVVVLERGAVVRGEVTVGGRPLDGVRISAGPPGTFSDADGLFRLDGVATGPVTVESYHPRYGALEKEIEVEMGENAVELAYRTGHEVRGQVVDESGRPVARAALELSTVGDPRGPYYRARSDVDGLFRVAPVATGEYRLEADKPGRVLVGPGTLRVDGDDLEGVRVVLGRGAVVSGTVLGLDFDDLARLDVRAEDGRERSVRGRLGHTGAYEIRDLPPGDWVVRATLGGGRRQVRKRIEIPPGGAEIRCDLRFERRLVLSGTLLLEDEPLAGASVSLTGRELAVEREAATDHRGRFKIEDLEPATYNLGLAHSRELVVTNRELVLDVDRDVVIRLVPARVSGRVLDAATGEPIAGALVTLVRLSGTGEETNALSTASDDSGAFDIPRAPAGTYRVGVRRDGYAAATWRLDLADGAVRRDLELELEPTPGAELRLRLAGGGVPTTVDLTVLGPEGPLLRESRPVEGDGRVVLPTLPQGVFQVVIRSPGTAPRRTTLAVPSEPVTVVLEPAGSLEVRVPDLVTSDAVASLRLMGPDGRAFESLDLYGLPADTWRVVGGRTTVEGLPAGTWTLRIKSADGQMWTGTVDTDSQTTAVVELR